eukprot:183728-Pelagomonas_calceolata.AAC.1
MPFLYNFMLAILSLPCFCPSLKGRWNKQVCFRPSRSRPQYARQAPVGKAGLLLLSKLRRCRPQYAMQALDEHEVLQEGATQ